MTDTVTVDVAQGTLRGRKTSSKSGGTYYSFQGIPYAKPPTGPLRFKEAEPPEPWIGVRDALKHAGTCTQFNAHLKRYEGVEDCLYLNVYSPMLPGSGSERPLPVMVWIHGGGFVFGSGNADIQGPDYLVDEGVIVVTFNYRLGILGFLCLNDPAAPGNVGLKDQVAALRWVQKNISKFGGDPNNVTIFGESAGAGSVHFHMLSPMSKGLFSRAIAQSGAAVNPWAIQKNPREMAFRVAEKLGYTGQHPEELVEFLQGINDMILVKAANEHGFSEEEKDGLIALAFTPALEVEAEGVERFLPASPLELLEEGRYHNVPYMTGMTEKEGILVFMFADLNKPEILEKLEENFAKIVLSGLRLPKNYKKTDEVVRKVRHFFLNDKPLTKDTLPGFIDFYSDLMFTEGIHAKVKKMAQLAKAPLYYYQFSYEGQLNFLKATCQINFPGASHADEIGYLFNVEMLNTEVPSDSTDALTRARMVKLWTNFAKTGNPTPEADPLLPVAWQPYTSANPCYLEIGEELTIKKHLLKERVQFWEELYRNL
ncbi:juvenile hormone esterase-like [Anabrus simplex]|uniref:juvenile hormone esterase-like n=1 Tax=Anabrus simplex TaxID=316456 RepID=UPI0035A282D2